MKPDESNLIALVDALSAGGTVDLLFYSGRIDNDGYNVLISRCTGSKDKEALLFLTTWGGSADAAFRIAKLLQEKYKKFSVFINEYCKSAGTLIAIGADEIIFSIDGEIGPLDVQLRQMDELGEAYMSGLDVRYAFSALNAQALDAYKNFLIEFRMGAQLSTEASSRMATELVIGLYSGIYEKIEPLKLGSTTRSMQIAHAYGTRLNQKSCNLKAKSLTRLVSGYPAHSFAILYDEAKDLFERVRTCSPTETAMAEYLKNLESLKRTDPDGGEYNDQVTIVDCINDIRQAVAATGAMKADVQRSAPPACANKSNAQPDANDAATNGDGNAKSDNKSGGAEGERGDQQHSSGTEPASDGTDARQHPETTKG